jgi:hypothetical protein
MKRPHRPFWVLKHLVTGKTKKVPSHDSEDGMWEVLLTDGSADGDIVRTLPPARHRTSDQEASQRARKDKC